MSCSAVSAMTPVASPSFASGLSPAFKWSVSPGLTCFRRNLLPSETRNGSAKGLAFRTTSFSFIFFLTVANHQGLHKVGTNRIENRHSYWQSPWLARLDVPESPPEVLSKRHPLQVVRTG